MGNIYKEAISVFGENHQIDKSIEEAAELIDILIKYKHGRATLEEVAEEVVDMSIMIVQLELIFPYNYKWLKVKKVKRLANIVGAQIDKIKKAMSLEENVSKL